MKILSPEQAYFAQEDASREQRDAHDALDTIEKARRLALNQIHVALTQLLDTIYTECNNVAACYPPEDPAEWPRILDMAHDLVHEVGFSEVDAIKEVAG
jgi:hypothetical protein